METVVPFEIEDPEAAAILASICQRNAKLSKKDRLIVDFDSGNIYPAVAKAKPSIGRNEPCPCKSGKKYKACCINKV